MAGVYVSFPFCAQKCTYCNFASGVFPRELEARYCELLVEEVRHRKWNWTPETVYLGGGTPSRWQPDSLRRVLDAVPGRPWREATMEAAPGDLTVDLVNSWRDAGINRVSFGTQSFVAKELAQTGRKHRAETVVAEVEMLRACGIENINLDLIAGLPFQTVASFHESLDWVLRLGVPHVSVYMLEVDEDSRLGNEILLGGVRYGASSRPDDEAIVAMYQAAIERLAAGGLPRYEISNFARPGWESLHNLKYWELAPYVGFGADAHSMDGGQRWQNAESAQAYVTQMERTGSGEVDRRPAEFSSEKFLVGLRLARGVMLTAEEWNRFEEPVARFIEQGLLLREGDILRLTGEGVLYSNEVLEEFVLS